MKKENSFVAFRYFIIANEQLSLFDIIDGKRNNVVSEYFKAFEIKPKNSYDFGGRKHIIVFNRKVNPQTYIFKFSRETTETMYKESDSDIENVLAINVPFIYLIVDIKRQIVLIENKTNVFSSINTAKNKVQKCLEIAFFDKGFEVILKEIIDQNTFWSYVESSKGIYDVSLILNSPNLFGGFINTNRMLKEINQQYNNSQTTIKVSNKKPNLRNINKNNEELADAVRYASGGGGEWQLTTHSENGKRTFKSRNNIKKVSVSRLDQQELIEEIDQEILNALNVIEDIFTDKDKR